MQYKYNIIRIGIGGEDGEFAEQKYRRFGFQGRENQKIEGQCRRYDGDGQRDERILLFSRFILNIFNKNYIWKII